MFSFLKKLFGKDKKSLSPQKGKEILANIKKIQSKTPKEQILEYDILYHVTLKELGYTWSFGEILKQEPQEIKNIQSVWELHKFRNTLAHELRDFDERYLVKQAKNYHNVLEIFVKHVMK